jgi:hypothetical protein
VLTSLSFAWVVGAPERFYRPRGIGAYPGLVPKGDQSGHLAKD